MFRSTRSVLFDLEAELRSLPADHVVYVLDGAWLVVGPTGVFVVTGDGDDVATAARWAAEQAEETRSRLADQIAFVPFVDAVVATASLDYDPAQPALVIPVDLVHFTICEGRTIVDDDSLRQLRLLGLPRLTD